MAEDRLGEVERIGIDTFDSDPRSVGGVRILRDPELYESLAALKEWPAAWNKEPGSAAFRDQVLGLGEQLNRNYAWDVAPHFALAAEVGDRAWPIHTDWEGATFLDPNLFTLWAPLSHFGEPQLMLFHPEVWPPPHYGFSLEKTGLYGRTMHSDEIYRRFATSSGLGMVELALEEGEVLAFNASVPHCTHPLASPRRSSVNLRCPANLGTRAEPRVRVNVTSPYALALLREAEPCGDSRFVREVDARKTPKGYFEVGPSVRHVERKVRARWIVNRIPGLGRLRRLLFRL